MVHDSSSWTVISFSTEGQPEDITMMEILNTWLDALLDYMCTQKYCMQEKIHKNASMEIAVSYHIQIL